MKKTLLVTILGLSAATANANWYVQGDFGVSGIKETEYALSATTTSQRLSVGYAFERFRVAVDYTNLSKANFDELDLSIKSKSLGISTFYDFKSSSQFTPYLGVRVANNSLKASANHWYYGKVSEKATRIGYGALGGVSYKLNPNLSLNLGAEVNALAGNVYQLGGNAGVRYSF